MMITSDLHHIATGNACSRQAVDDLLGSFTFSLSHTNEHSLISDLRSEAEEMADIPALIDPMI